MNKTVSVIIPVYKVEQYLPACIESVLGQSYPNLQIILVNDGSPDRCGEICDHYAQLDDRVTVIHKPNGGLSDARNTGLSVACGKFVFYLDSDDYLDKDAIAHLVEAQTSSNADIIIGNYYYTYSDYEQTASFGYSEPIVLNKYKALEALATGKIQNFAWGKLIRTEIATKHLFPIGKLFEDHYWAHLIISDANKVAFLPKPLVHYRQRKESISFTYTIDRLDILDGWQCRKDFFDRISPDLSELYLQFIAPLYTGLAWLVLTRMKKDRRRAFEQLRHFSESVHLADYANGDVKKKIQNLQKSNALYAVFAIIERFKRGN